MVLKYARKTGRMIDERTAAESSIEKKVAAAIDFIVDELIFSRALNHVFYNLNINN